VGVGLQALQFGSFSRLACSFLNSSRFVDSLTLHFGALTLSFHRRLHRPTVLLVRRALLLLLLPLVKRNTFLLRQTRLFLRRFMLRLALVCIALLLLPCHSCSGGGGDGLAMRTLLKLLLGASGLGSAAEQFDVFGLARSLQKLLSPLGSSHLLICGSLLRCIVVVRKSSISRRLVLLLLLLLCVDGSGGGGLN
jgi:hypothetical protein